MVISKNLFLYKQLSTVAIQCHDGVPWIHGTVLEHSDSNHSSDSYTVCIITSDSIHVEKTPIATEQYLLDQLMKNSKTTGNKGDFFWQPQKQIACSINQVKVGIQR